MTRSLQFPMISHSHLGCNRKGYKSKQWLHSSLVCVGNNCEICLPSSVSALKQRWRMKCHITCEHQPCFLWVVNLTTIYVQTNLDLAPITWCDPVVWQNSQFTISRPFSKVRHLRVHTSCLGKVRQGVAPCSRNGFDGPIALELRSTGMCKSAWRKRLISLWCRELLCEVGSPQFLHFFQLCFSRCAPISWASVGATQGRLSILRGLVQCPKVYHI